MADGVVTVQGYAKNDVLTAINRLNPQSGLSTLYFPDGTYVGSGFNIPSNTKVIFAKGAVVVPDSPTAEVFMLRGKFPSSYAALTADSLKGDVVLNVSSASDFDVGDWVYIRSRGSPSGY